MNQQSQQFVAKQYAKMGINVFPCTKTKKPIPKTGFKAATTDISQIEAWWDKHPDALIGSPNDQFTVIDIDDYDVPADARLIISGTVAHLKESNIIPTDVLSVKTMSGGTHLYFHKDENLTRKIHALPQIDILANGGYVILPDQKNYVASENMPWEYFEFLPKLKTDELFKYADEIHEITKKVNRDVKDFRSGIDSSDQTEMPLPVPASSTSKKKAKKKVKQETRIKNDVDEYNEVRKQHPHQMMGAADYENDIITFDIKEGIYKRTEKEIEKADPNENLFSEDGTIHIDEGQLDSKQLMRMFYNRGVQVKLAEFLGLFVPSHKGTLARSILPGHIDFRPSMGVRWSEEGAHLLIRDFSNHFNDKFEQVDFNLVRLFAVLKYKTNVPRLNSPSFTMWFLRMMVDAKIINVDHLKSPIIKSTDKLNKYQKHLLESIQLLDAIKKLHCKYDGEFVAADKFMAAWSGLSLSTTNRHKKTLEDNGFIVFCGFYNCCPDREDDFFHTKLYMMPKMKESGGVKIKGNHMKLSEAVNINIKKPVKGGPVNQDKEEKDIQQKYPSLSTFAGFVLGPQYHEKIKNFCDDFGINNVPDGDDMIITTYMSDEYKDLDDVVVDDQTTYYADKFTFEIVDGISGEVSDNKVLLVHSESPPLLAIINEGKAKHGYDIEEPTVNFIISSYLGDDFDESRLEYLEMIFNRYVPFVGTNTYKVMHMTREQIFNLMDGKSPIIEDD